MILGVLFFVLSGIAEAGMDVLMFRFNRSIFSSRNSFMNPTYSWKNKWDNLIAGAESPWWYFGMHTPQFKEAFPFSSTILVGLTDGWHMFKLLKNITLILGIVFLIFAGVWWLAVLGYVFNRGGFMFGYSKLFISKSWKKW